MAADPISRLRQLDVAASLDGCPHGRSHGRRETTDTARCSKMLQLIAEELRGLADVGNGQVNTAVRSAMTAMQAARRAWVG
jgi:hypothetical protein